MLAKLSKLARPTSAKLLPISISSRSVTKRPYDELDRTFVRPSFFCDQLKANNLNFFCGVPDSLLKDFCGYLSDHTAPEQHIIVPNEGSAIGVASGYHFKTGKIPVVYFQNSGLGNAVNPLLSLTHQNVYSIPMLLLIGWRGEVGRKDEPQHLVMGEVMCDMLKLMRIPFDILPDYESGIQHSIQTAVQYTRNNKAPYAFLVRKRTFENYEFVGGANGLNDPTEAALTRSETLQLIVDNMNPKAAFVSTTGFTSRELYEIRQSINAETGSREVKEFLTVGSMGHSSSIAMGIAHAVSDDGRDVVCIDGDGALLMHMGAMSMVGNSGCENIKHILINNGCHDSVGGQPTTGFQTDFVAVAKACGYKAAESAATQSEITAAVQRLNKATGPCFLEIKSIPGTHKNLSRPKSSPVENKHAFMSFISTE